MEQERLKYHQKGYDAQVEQTKAEEQPRMKGLLHKSLVLWGLQLLLKRQQWEAMLQVRKRGSFGNRWL